MTIDKNGEKGRAAGRGMRPRARSLPRHRRACRRKNQLFAGPGVFASAGPLFRPLRSPLRSGAAAESPRYTTAPKIDRSGALFDRITPMVSATVDAAALRHNLSAVRRRAPHSRVMAVVKANAYGHGLVAVAHALAGADAFAVARVDEGLMLRRAGIVKPIVLLEGVFDAAQLAAAGAAGFELVVHAPEQVALLRAGGAHSFRIWLKMD